MYPISPPAIVRILNLLTKASSRELAPETAQHGTANVSPCSGAFAFGLASGHDSSGSIVGLRNKVAHHDRVALGFHAAASCPGLYLSAGMQLAAGEGDRSDHVVGHHRRAVDGPIARRLQCP